MSSETVKFIRVGLVIFLVVPSILIRWAILNRNQQSRVVGWWMVGLGLWQGMVFSAMFINPNDLLRNGIEPADVPIAILGFSVISMFMILGNSYALKYHGIRKGDQIIYPLKDDN